MSEPLRRTSELYWSVFRSLQNGEEVPSALRGEGLERHRLTCLAGFTALDAALARCWRVNFAPDWAEVGTYLKVLLATPDALAPFFKATESSLRRGPWMATLRFIANTGDPLRFSPTFTDVAALLVILSPHRLDDREFQSFTAGLFRLQKLRNACVHTGREFTELEAREALRLLARTERELDTHLYPKLSQYGPTPIRGVA